MLPALTIEKMFNCNAYKVGLQLRACAHFKSRNNGARLIYRIYIFAWISKETINLGFISCYWLKWL